VSARALSEVDAELGLGKNRIHLQGAFGLERDVMRFELDAPALQALGSQWSGNVRARGSVSGTFAQPGFEADATARALALPGGYIVEMREVRGRVPREVPAQFELSAHAEGGQAEGKPVQSADLHGSGSLGRHQLEAH